jgi:hypothetical protein
MGEGSGIRAFSAVAASMKKLGQCSGQKWGDVVFDQARSCDHSSVAQKEGAAAPNRRAFKCRNTSPLSNRNPHPQPEISARKTSAFPRRTEASNRQQKLIA